jgi:hypothetical protein
MVVVMVMMVVMPPMMMVMMMMMVVMAYSYRYLGEFGRRRLGPARIVRLQHRQGICDRVEKVAVARRRREFR